jgi:hypothetical protein
LQSLRRSGDQGSRMPASIGRTFRSEYRCGKKSRLAATWLVEEMAARTRGGGSFEE